MAFGLSAGAAALIAAGTTAAVGMYAANKASSTQSRAAGNATQLQQNIYDQNQQNLHPYMDMGAGAGQTLASMLKPGGQLTQSFTPADYLANKDPGYDFQLKQGTQALQNSQAAGNGVLSGTALKDLIAFNQNFASTGYQNAFDRWQAQNTNVYNRLMGMTQVGENAAAGAGNTGASIGANMANSMIGGANANAAGTVGVANAISGGINSGMGYYMLGNMMNKPGTMPVNTSDPYGYASGQDMIASFGGS